MATGKTHPRYTTVTFNSQNITGSVNSISGLGLTYDQSDVTTFDNTVKQYLTGYGDATVQISGPVNNTAATGGHVVFAALNGTNTAATLTVAVGIRAAPTGGDPEFEGSFVVTDYQINLSATDATYTATLKPAFGAAAPAWGTVS